MATLVVSDSQIVVLWLLSMQCESAAECAVRGDAAVPGVADIAGSAATGTILFWCSATLKAQQYAVRSRPCREMTAFSRFDLLRFHLVRTRFAARFR